MEGPRVPTRVIHVGGEVVLQIPTHGREIHPGRDADLTEMIRLPDA